MTMNIMNGPNVRKPHGQQPASLFSRLFSSHKHSNSMPNVVLNRRPVSPTLLNDPAFSPDPTAHPLHTPSHTSSSSWSASTGTSAQISNFDPLLMPPGHPLLKKDQQATLPARRPPLPLIAVANYSPVATEGDPLRLPLQPPNTPQADGPGFPDQRTQSSRQVLRSENNRGREPSIPFPFRSPGLSDSTIATNLSLSSQAMPLEPTSESSTSVDSTPESTPPSSAGSHSPIKSETGFPVSQSLVAEEPTVPSMEKARTRNKTFSFFRRKSTPVSPPTQPQLPVSPTKAKLTKVTHAQATVTRSTLPAQLASTHIQPSSADPRRGHARAESTHALHRPHGHRNPLSTPPTEPSASPQAQSAQKLVPRPVQIHGGLDRIDELDETNPFGARVHHGGPYEAISRLVETGGKQCDLDYSYQARPHKASKHQPSLNGSSLSSISVPQSTSFSLNIVPGQILPRDFTYGRLPIRPNMQTRGSAPLPNSHQSLQENLHTHGPSSQPGYGHGVQPLPTDSYTLDGDTQAGGPPSAFTAFDPNLDQRRGFQQAAPLPQSQFSPASGFVAAKRPSPLPTLQPRSVSPFGQPTHNFPAKQAPSNMTPEFDPYASYSPTAIPRHLDDPASPPCALPEPRPRPRSPSPMTAATPESTSTPGTSLPSEPLPPSYQPFARSNSVRGHPNGVKSPLPARTRNLQPPDIDPSRKPSPVSSNYGSTRDAYGGIDGDGSDDGSTVDERNPGQNVTDSQEPSRKDIYASQSRSDLKPAQGSENGPSESQAPLLDVKESTSLSHAPQFSTPQSIPEPPAVLDQRLDEFPRLQPLPASSASVRTGVSRPNRAPPPKTSHLPKKLVMPAPLQQQNQQSLPRAGFQVKYDTHSNFPQRHHPPRRYPPPQPSQPTYISPYPHLVYPSDQGNDRGYSRGNDHDYDHPQSPQPDPMRQAQNPHGPLEQFLHSPPPFASQLHSSFSTGMYPDHPRQQTFHSRSPHPSQFDQYPRVHDPHASPSPDISNPGDLHNRVALPTRAQEVPMAPDRKVLRKKSMAGSKDHGSPFSGVGSSGSVPAGRALGGKEPTPKERLRMEKEREREKEKELKERENLRQRQEKATGQRIPKRVLSKRRNDI